MIVVVILIIAVLVFTNVSTLLYYINTLTRSEIADIRNNYNALLSNYTIVYTALQNSLKQISDAQNKLFLMNQTTSSLILNCNSTISNLTQVNNELANQNRNLSNMLYQLNATLNTYKQMSENLSRILLQLNQSYNDLNSNYTELNHQYQQLQALFQVQAQQLINLSNQLVTLTSAYEKARQFSLIRGTPNENLTGFIDYNSNAITNAVNAVFNNTKINIYVAMYQLYNYIKNNILFNYDTPFLVLGDWKQNQTFSVDRLYFKSGSEVLKLGMGDGKDQAMLLATMYYNYMLNYYGSSPRVFVILLSGSGPKNYPYHGFFIMLHGSGKISLIDTAAAELSGFDYNEFVQVNPTDIYTAITSYFGRLSSLDYNWNKIVCAISPSDFYLLNYNVTEFISWLYSIDS